MKSIRREKPKPSVPTNFVRHWGYIPTSGAATNTSRPDGDLEDYASSGPNGFAFAQNE